MILFHPFENRKKRESMREKVIERPVAL